MDNEVGRAGFHVTHEFRASKRGAILDEMMREKIPGASERWAQRNPNIVLEDEDLNIAIVNNGKGWFSLCKGPKKVLAYGEERLAKLSHRVKEPKLDPKKGKEWGGTRTSSMFVIHLPTTLCEEVEDFYPVFDDDGNDTGRKRSRLVARDRDEALRYFKDVLNYLAEEVIPGGQEAILGADIQFSESRPHIQILADTFAPDPKHPGQLRSEFSRAYGEHRDVRDEKGKQIGGPAKIGRYQEGFRKRMVELGWPVELDVDPLRHDKTATKAVYGALKDKERALAEQEQNLVVERGKAESELEKMVNELADGWVAIDSERNELAREREQLQEEKKKALEEARARGYAKGFEEGRADVEREREKLSKEWTTLRSLEGAYDRAIADVENAKPALPSEEEMRKFVREESPSLAMQYLAHRDVLLRENGKKPFHRESFERFALSRLGTEWKEKWMEPSQTNKVVLDARRQANELRSEREAIAERVAQANDGLSL